MSLFVLKKKRQYRMILKINNGVIMQKIKKIFVGWVVRKFICTCPDAIGCGTHAVCGKDSVDVYLQG